MKTLCNISPFLHLKEKQISLDMKKTTLIISFYLILTILNASAQNSFKVEKTGKGQPIMLFPGFACTDEVFEDIKGILSKNYELHAFTFAGFGEVPPIPFPWLPQIKTDIEKYVQENNLKDPIIIGHSLGGTLGLWLASESSEYANLIVIDALPAMGALMMADYNSEAIVYDNPQNAQMLSMDQEAFGNMALQTAAFMTHTVEKQQTIANWMVASDRETYVYGYTDLLKLDLREALGKIKTPVHILAATHPYGKEAAEATYKKQYEKLQDYSLKFAEGSAHFIMYDQPEWLMDQIQTALQKNE